MRWVTVRVLVTPRAKSNEIVGERDGELVVRVSAPPEDGRANAAVCRLLADALGVRARCVSVAHGERSRHKVLRVTEMSSDELSDALARLF